MIAELYTAGSADHLLGSAVRLLAIDTNEILAALICPPSFFAHVDLGHVIGIAGEAHFIARQCHQPR
jgi:hypothetical protein